MRKQYNLAWIVSCAAVAVLQYLTVRLGLTMGIAHGNVSPVWPATGFAIAVLLRYGINLWPGVAVGSFLGLVQTGVGSSVAAGEAAAALLEAVTGVWLVRRWIKAEDPLARTRDVIGFCIVAGGIATAISATVGVTSLSLAGVVPWKSFEYHWGTWWLGDVMGSLIVAPFLITWTGSGACRLDRVIWFKTGTVFVVLILAGVLAFWGPFVSSTGASDYPIAFLTLPIVVAATFLSGRKGATAACVICSVMAISGTVQGLGPFFRGSVNESLLLLQSYLVVVSVTSIILAAVLNERNRALNELRHSQEDLENRIAERTLEVSQANGHLKREIAERERAEDQVKASLREKEILLREIHHRVKNNLTLISSLLTLQAGHADRTHRRLFDDLEARVMSMAMAHEKLYKSENLAYLNLDEYVSELTDHLVGSNFLGPPIQLRKEIQNSCLGLDTAIPLGFILTELVSNCLKHAFPDGREGVISISLRSIGEKEFELVVRDNGVGIPKDIDLENASSLGMDLVNAFANKLRGRIEVLSDNGTEIRLRFEEV